MVALECDVLANVHVVCVAWGRHFYVGFFCSWLILEWSLHDLTRLLKSVPILTFLLLTNWAKLNLFSRQKRLRAWNCSPKTFSELALIVHPARYLKWCHGHPVWPNKESDTWNLSWIGTVFSINELQINKAFQRGKSDTHHRQLLCESWPESELSPAASGFSQG